MKQRAASLEQAVERVTQELDGTRRRLARVAAEQEEEQAAQDDTVRSRPQGGVGRLVCPPRPRR